MHRNRERKRVSLEIPYQTGITSVIFFFSLVFAFAATSTVLAQTDSTGGVTDDQVNAVAKQLYCPVCENIPLDVCGTQACAQWRDLIHEKLSQGWTEDEIKTYFVDQYGDRVLDEPPRRGLNWLIYIVPPVAFLLGAYFLIKGFRSWRQPEKVSQTITPGDEIEDEYLDLLEEQLKESD